MPYTRRNWQNAPSSATPLNAAALNNIEDGVEAAYDAVTGRLSEPNLAGTFVSVRNNDGTPVTGPKFVVLTLSVDGTEVDDIAVYNSLDEVG